ncbi:MAG: alpha/beta fold hydrolase [Chitinophagaceae bacterium]
MMNNFTKHFFTTLIILLLAGTNIALAQNKTDNPVFVLVHGAWHGGWCWQDISQNLRAKGYRVYTPTLSGLGEHKNTTTDNVNLQTHITDIINLIEMEDLRNVILVGHSYAGTVITGVADSIPERLSKLVYLDAMIVHNGESALSVQTEETQNYMNRIIEQKQNVPPVSAENFGVSDTVKAKWVNDRLTPQPFNTFTQKLILKHKFGNNIPLVYIACVNPQLPVLEKLSKEAQNNSLWTYYTLNTGHDAMITMPKELSKLFIKVAK